MLKKTIFLILLICLPAGSQAAQDSVRLTTLEWLPYAGSSLPNQGFSSEIITKAFAASGIKATVAFQPWVDTLESVAQGRHHALFSAYYTDARAKKYLFSEPYAESLLHFYKLKGTTVAFKKLEDLKGYRIGIIKGFSNTREFDNADYLTKFVFDTEKQSLENLLQGSVDLIIMDQYVCLDLLNHHFSDFKQQVEALSKPIEKRPLYLLFSKKVEASETLVKKFNAGLETIRKSGLYELIMRRHRFSPEKMVSVATLNWPPYTGEKDDGYGFVSEIVAAAYKKVGYRVSLLFRPWARALAETEVGRHDIAFPAYYSDERKQTYELVKLEVKSTIGFMKSRKLKITKYDSLKELAPFRIGVVHGYVNRPDFDRAVFLKKTPFYSDLENIKALIAGMQDLIVIDPMVAGYLMKKHGYDTTQWDFLTPMLDEKDLYLAFSRQVPEFRKKKIAFEYGLEELKKEGRLDALIKKYWFKE